MHQQKLSAPSCRANTFLLGEREREKQGSFPSDSEDMAETKKKKKKAVLFNFWGVAVSSRPRAVFHKLEESHHLPGESLPAEEQFRDVERFPCTEDGAMRRAEIGEMTLSQMIPAFEAEVVTEAKVKGVTLPSDWSVGVLLQELRDAMTDVQRDVLETAARLRHSDDSAAGDRHAHLLSLLGGHFDLVLQSCRSDEEGVKAAEGAGMTAILVENLNDALNKLADFTGVQPGVRTHFVEMGSGPPVLLCHGFPESWYSWRYQIPAVAAAGFRVLALDMKGYGESTAPPDVEEYSQEQLCKDLITFMDKMSLPQVTLVGHDWGGILVWTMAQYYPERVRAVASLNTPLFPVDPAVPPAERMKAGVAEAELEKDLERTFKIFFFSSGLFVGLPEQIPRGRMLTEADLQYYVSQYKERGFRRPLNWYRNGEANWRWMCSRPTGKLLMPALMVTAGKDQVLLPAFSKGMEDLIPNLSRGHIEECGHWTQMDKPAETNRILVPWLRDTLKAAGGGSLAPK
ncbi:hypothetical protein FQN60_006550, partial [Etheostoma spectabile]